MKIEKDPQNYFLNTIISVGISLFAMNALSKFAFVPRIRRQIKEQAHGVCQTCLRNVGTDKLIASHNKHKTQNVEDGIAQCIRCEAEHHIKHLKCPHNINMKKIDNDSTAWGHYLSLEENDQESLYQIYPDEINYLTKQFS